MAARQRKSRARRKAFAAVFDTVAEPTPPPKPPDIPRPKLSFEEPPAEPMVVFQPDVKQPLTTVRTDSDGKLVHEPMRDRYGERIHDAPPAPPPPPPPAKRLTHLERVAPASTMKPMCQWSLQELEAHKRAQREIFAPPERGSLDWFIRACNHRNGF